MIEETFLTTEEVLGYLQVNLRTVYRLIKAGKIPAVRVGRQWRFRKTDIDAWLDNQRTSGTVRSSRMPGAEILSDAAPSRAADASADRRPRVLVVDDEESIRDLLQQTLQREYDVELAPDGVSALERLRANDYDLLIADLKMPGLDGLSLVDAARRFHPKVPIIIITGYSTEASAIAALNLGVSQYLVKPFRIVKVLDAVSKALGETA